MVQMYNQEKRSGAINQATLRLLRCVGVSTLAVTLLSGVAMAKTTAILSADNSASSGKTVENVGFPITPLSAKQMSTEAAQGLPSAGPGLSPQSQGGGSVVLWDEIIPSKAAAQNTPISGTVTLSIVN